jgi:multicomponent K+:H+ antiporter subunit D
LGSTGTLLLPISLWTQEAMAAALVYLFHATIAGAVLFLVADVTLRRRGQYGDAAVPSPQFSGQAAAGLLFLGAAIAAVGLPPLSGFIGKLLILSATSGAAQWWAIWAAILGTTFLGVVGFSRSGSAVYWKAAADDARAITRAGRSSAEFVSPAGMLGLLAALTIGAGWVTAQAEAAAAQIFAPGRMVQAVLGGEAGA